MPATNPERMLSEAPPCFEDVTISFTCRLSVEVKIFVNSGISAPAMVPNEMMVERSHQSSGGQFGCFESRTYVAA